MEKVKIIIIIYLNEKNGNFSYNLEKITGFPNVQWYHSAAFYTDSLVNVITG